MRIEDVKRAAAAVRLWVGTGEDPSQHKQFPSEHAAAVVGQRRDLPFSLEGTRKDDEGVGGGIKKLNTNKHSPPPWSTSSSVCPECERR